MKLIQNLICAGTLVLAVSAYGAKADNNANVTAKKGKGGAQANAQANVHANAGAHTNRSVHTNARVNTNANMHANVAGQHRRTNAQARENNSARMSNARKVNNVTRVNRPNVVNRKVVVNKERVRNIRVVNNWHTARFSGSKYVVFRNYARVNHPAAWWHSHYNRVVFINGGWYAWNDGWWYPAWGYAPGITFAFDGPIYGYNGWTPDRVTMAVQQQLADDGYYDGPVDGVLGEYTRQALAAYQEDHNLEVTSAIDEPTLDTLGLA